MTAQAQKRMIINNRKRKINTIKSVIWGLCVASIPAIIALVFKYI